MDNIEDNVQYVLYELNERLKDVNDYMSFYENTGYNKELSDGYDNELNNLSIITNDIDILESNPDMLDFILPKYRDYEIGLESGLSGAQLFKDYKNA